MDFGIFCRNILVITVYLTSTIIQIFGIKYEALFSGTADIGVARLPGDLYWRSPDGESRAYAFYGIKYGNSKRFEGSWLNTDFSYLSTPDRSKFGPHCMQHLPPSQNNFFPNLFTQGQPKGHRAAGHHNLLATEAANTDMNEDCLYLDVYIPAMQREQKISPTQRKPVMVFVHGSHAGNKMPGIGTDFSRIHNIIVVSVQYRLGIFGFLSTEDVNARGNYGLGDVRTAVQWVRQYIFAFGGNPEKITVVGHGTGAVLVSAMMLDPEIRSIISAAICMSGSVLSPSAITRAARMNAASVANALRCPSSTTTEMVLCYKIASATDIITAVTAAFPSISIHSPVKERFSLNIDGHHIPYKPEWVLQSQSWHFRGGFLNGFLAEDASLSVLNQWPEVFSQGNPTLENVKAIYIPYLLRSVVACSLPPLSIVEAVYNRYGFGSTADPKSLRKNLINLANDIGWRIPAVKEAIVYAEKNLTELGNQVYKMSFNDHIGQYAFGLQDLGMFHGLDTQYLFAASGTSNLLGNRTNERVTRQLRLLWTYVASYSSKLSVSGHELV
ncbi:LOW QUALITY PROTEIN: pyrethroid hydrolase Ces2a-like [Paramacrobiotus metropolitanus]|uniref:LOW QUALITY PROTEIN: pyrethroid hydrolase Ces2a-like n=1 Tax=Paramacrobiotus metropolitanus TaxID=2943436 RepID=UPI0024462ED0|nr:LOW QUALITY PROTEIN: pyrethroid hydrolase Ces2a-like [Paramacrobiotus metropolitanus]